VNAYGGGFEIEYGLQDHFDDLSPTEQRQVARTLGRAGDDGSYVLGQLDDAASRQRFFELVRQGEMDGKDVKAMARMLRGEGKYVDNQIRADDLLEIAKRGDLDDTVLVTKRDGSVRWLEQGDDITGLRHILEQHRTQFIEDQSYIDDTDDLKTYIKEAIEDGDAHRIPEKREGGTAYQLKVRDAGPEDNDFVTVIVGDNGYVVTARPGKYNA
jgi:hypothetical protein